MSRSLTFREEGVLYYALKQQGVVSYSGDKEAAQETSQSINRSGKVAVNFVPCVLPGSRISLLKQKRVLTGFECLHLQGFEPEFITRVTEALLLGNRKLMDLAGNAFSGGVVSQAVAGALSTTDLERALAVRSDMLAASSAASSQA